MKSHFLFLAMILLAGCGEQSRATTARPGVHRDTLSQADVSRTNQTTYDEIRGGTGLKRTVSLCYLLRFYSGGAGAYRVKNITGFTEELPALPGHFDGFTYLELELIADWSGNAPANPAVRIVGGPKDSKITKGWAISAKKGEVLGVLLEAARPANGGYYGVDELTVFRQATNGGYTNGQLFTRQAASLDTVGHAVERIAKLGAACDQADVLPDVEGVSVTGTAAGQISEDGGMP